MSNVSDAKKFFVKKPIYKIRQHESKNHICFGGNELKISYEPNAYKKCFVTISLDNPLKSYHPKEKDS
jgi:hypothetical protein